MTIPNNQSLRTHFLPALMLAFLACCGMLTAHAANTPDEAPRPTLAEDNVLDRIVAVVNDEIILQSDFYQAIYAIEQQYKDAGEQLPPFGILQEQVMNRLIMTKLQVDRAQEQGIRVSQSDVFDAIERIAADNNLTLDGLRDQIIREGGDYGAFQRDIADQLIIQQLRDQVVHSSVQITDSEVDNLLKDPNFNAPQVHLAHIDIQLPNGATASDIQKAEEKAAQVMQALRGGMAFHRAATQYSDAQDALDGGDLGWVSLGEIPPDFAQLLQSLNTGDVSEPLHAPGGIQIFKLYERRDNTRDVVEQWHVRHILISPSELLSPAQARDKAVSIYQQLQEDPSAFIDLAKRNSSDKSTANIGGDLGWIQPQQLDSQSMQVIMAMQKGAISRPVETRQGWHIYQIEDKRQADITDETERMRARAAIGNRKAEETYDDFLRQLRSQAYIDVRIPSLRDLDGYSDANPW